MQRTLTKAQKRFQTKKGDIGKHGVIDDCTRLSRLSPLSIPSELSVRQGPEYELAKRFNATLDEVVSVAKHLGFQKLRSMGVKEVLQVLEGEHRREDS